MANDNNKIFKFPSQIDPFPNEGFKFLEDHKIDLIKVTDLN